MRDLVVLDLETTGVSVETDRIVQFAAVRGGRTLNMLINPGVSIPEQASAVHGITDDAVAGCPRFADVADVVLEFLDDADLGGYNLYAYDLPLLLAEMFRCGRELDLNGRNIIDGLTVFRHFEPRTLTKALQRYCGREHTKAHDALADVVATAAIIAMQGIEYGCDHDELARISRGNRVTLDGKIVCNEAGEASLSFGKHKGVALAKVDRSYLRWLLGTELSRETAAFIRRVLEA